jgi:hypothetical protein
MKWISIGILLLSSSHLFAQNKGTINPIQSCPEFFISYEKKQTEDKKEFYEVSFEEKDRSISTFKVSNIKDFVIVSEDSDPNTKDLNFINQLRRRAKEICSKEVAEGVEQCLEVDKNFTPDFHTLIKDVGEIVKRDESNICENMPYYSQLILEVNDLKGMDLIKFREKKGLKAKLFKSMGNRGTKKIIEEKYRNILKITNPQNWEEELKKLDDNGYLEQKRKESIISTNELIDAYLNCGGQKESEKFIKSLIKVQVIESCMAPKPPGMISEKELEEISSRISRKYKNTFINSINNKKDELTLETVKEIANVGITNTISEQFGSLIEPDVKNRPEKLKNFIDDLKSLKLLNDIKTNSDLSSEISDYASHVLATNAPIEIGEKLIPYVVKTQLKEKLPTLTAEQLKKKTPEQIKAFEENRKKAEKDLESYVGNRFNLCIEKYKTYALYNEKNQKKQMYTQMMRKEKFCKEERNKDSPRCGNDPCLAPNALKEDAESSDMQVIQGCMFQSIFSSIEFISKEQVIASTEDMGFTKEATEILQKQTWESIQSCAKNELNKNNKINKRFLKGIKGELSDDGGGIYFEEIDQNTLSETLEKCAVEATKKTSRAVASLTLLQTKDFRDNFILIIGDDKSIKDKEIKLPSNESLFEKTWKPAIENDEILLNEQTNKYPLTNYDPNNEYLIKTSQEIIEKAFDPCYSELERKNKLSPEKYTVDATLCEPIMMIETARRVIEGTLLKQLDKAGVKEEMKTKILKDYKICTDKAFAQSLNDVGEEGKLKTGKEAKEYLDQNIQFAQCAKNAMISSAPEIAEISYLKTIEELINPKEKGKVSPFSDIKFVKDPQIINGVKQTVQKCFEKELKDINKFSEINKLSTSTTLAEIEQKCTNAATSYFLPRALINESKISLTSMSQNGGYISTNQINEINKITADQLIKEYNLVAPENLKGPELILWVYEQAVNKDLESGKTAEGFGEKFKNLQTTSAIKVVHKNLNEKIQVLSGTNNSEMAKFGDAFGHTCLEKMYTKFMANKKTKPGEAPLTLDGLANYIYQGLDFVEKSGANEYKKSLTSLKSDCDNFSKFKTEVDFNKSEFYKIILKGQIYNELSTSFKNQIAWSIEDEIKNLKEPYKEIKLKYIEIKKKGLNDLMAKYLDNRDNFNKTIFENSTILDFAGENLDKLLSGDNEVKGKLQENLLKQLFKNQLPGSFSDEFARINIESSVGTGGLEPARKKAISTAKEEWADTGFGYLLGQSSEKYGRRAVNLFSDPDKIKNLVQWDKLAQESRSAKQDLIFKTMILDATLSPTGEAFARNPYTSERDKFFSAQKTYKELDSYAPKQKHHLTNINHPYPLTDDLYKRLQGAQGSFEHFDKIIFNEANKAATEYLSVLKYQSENPPSNSGSFQNTSTNLYKKYKEQPHELVDYLVKKIRNEYLQENMLDGLNKDGFIDRVSDQVQYNKNLDN